MLTGLVLEQRPEHFDLDRLRHERLEQRLGIGLDLVAARASSLSAPSSASSGGVKGSSCDAHRRLRHRRDEFAEDQDHLVEVARRVSPRELTRDVRRLLILDVAVDRRVVR